MSELSIVIVVGESSENQDQPNFLSHIKDGISSVMHFDSLNVNKLLNSVEGPEPHSKYGFKFSSAEANIVVLQNATIECVLNEVANAFSSLPKGVLLVYSGLICQSTANWILSTGVLKPEHVADRVFLVSEMLHQTLADTTLESKPPIVFHVACTSVPFGGEWRRVISARLPPSIAGHPLCSTVNRMHALNRKPVPGSPASIKPELAPLPSDISGVEAFCQRLESVIELSRSPQPTCQPVSKAKNCSICIRRPCLYIFPEGSGQSSIFALSGFTLLVNAGSTRDSKCWKLIQHFENIDAILHTHWSVENCLGLRSLLPALMATNDASSQTKSTLILSAPPGHAITHPLSAEASVPSDPLVINVAIVANELAEAVKPFMANDKLTTQEVTRGGRIAAMPKPICLYYKVGCGSLDFYPLTPTEEDQAEIKKLATLWAKAAPNVASALAEAPRGTSTVKTAALPLVSLLSVSGLLIWKPHRKGDRQIRILFVAPNAHQLRVLSALEALHLGLPCIRNADPETASSVATSAGNGAGIRKAPSAPAAPRTTMKATSAAPRTAASIARAPSATKPTTSITARSTKASAGTLTGNTNTKLTKRVPKLKESPNPTPQKSMTLKHEPPKETAKTMAKVEKEEEVSSLVAEMNEVPTPNPAPVSSEETSAFPTNDLSPEVTSASPNPKVVEDLNGDAADSVDPASPPKSPLKEEEPIVDGIYHHTPFEETEATELPAEIPAEPLNPLEDWGQPQAMPSPIAKSAKSSPAVKTTAPIQFSPEGYYEASAGGMKGLIDKLTKHTFVDVAFLPGGGETYLVDAEFFKRVSARYYIGTTAAPTADLLKAILVGKKASSCSTTEGNGSREASLILAHDSPGLLEWSKLNKKLLEDAKIDLVIVAERSNIQVMNSEGMENGNVSCPGFRLDF